MYKDKDKQREANRKASRRARIKHRVKTDLTPLAQGMTDEGMTPGGLIRESAAALAGKEHSMDCDPDTLAVFEESIKPERTAQGNIRVSKPGDEDYVPQCETTRAFVEGRPKRVYEDKPVKVFADLPPDVQQTIDKLSVVDGKIDQTIKANRTAIAVNYQHLFPDRYYGAAI